MKRLLILNGPNLNMLGYRDPEIYGDKTLQHIETDCRARAAKYGLDIDFRQSNHEGEMVDWIQQVVLSKHEPPVGVIINAAGYTHTSVAIHDALKMLSCPVIEVHLSDPKSREDFRRRSYIEPVAAASFSGDGIKSYVKAIDYFSSQAVET